MPDVRSQDHVDQNKVREELAGGKERIVTPGGDVVAGERCKAGEADGYGYISHFATCPGYRRS